MMKTQIFTLILFWFSSFLIAQSQTGSIGSFGSISINGIESGEASSPENAEATLAGFPPIWNIPLPGTSTMGIIITLEANPRLNDIPIEPNDYIGCFYVDDNGQQRCGGAGPWPGTQGLLVSANGDNTATPEKDGFGYQEQIYFRIFSQARMKDYPIDIIEFDPESITEDLWYPLSLSTVIDFQALEVFDFYISTSQNPVCIGDPLVLNAVEFIGTTGNYTYQWSSDPPGFNYTIPNPPATYPLQDITYYLTVEDGTHVSEAEYPILVYLNPSLTVSQDGLICENASFAVSATAANYSSTLWTSSGDGTFANATKLAASYYPGQGDISFGQASLICTAFPKNPCTLAASDNLLLTIQQYPDLEAGANIQVCKTETNEVPLNASGTNISTIQWTSAGDGTFANPAQLSTIYYPGTMDLYFNTVNLSISAQAIVPCVLQISDQLNVSFYTSSSCNAPSTLTRCENVPVNLAGNAQNASATLWTTAGDGTFENPAIINTKYYAGPNDILNQGTTVTLNAIPIAPCQIPATKNVNLNIKPLPKLLTFGSGTNFMCPGDNFLQLDAELAFYSSFSWASNGDGYFTGATTLSPKYYPGTADFQNGFFNLILTATSVSPCMGSQQFTLETIFADEPEVSIINPLNGTTFCGEAALEAGMISAQAISWQSNGDGSFDNAQALAPVYFPGSDDISSSSPISITATASPLCPQFSAAQDVVFLSFIEDASVNAGSNATICETSTYMIDDATATFYDELLWLSQGDGTFNNPQILNPEYFPGAGDIASGSATLSLSATSLNPCSGNASDALTLTISQAPQANAGADMSGCEQFTLNGSASDYSQIMWATSGDGSFDNAATLSTIYHSGANDILTGQVVVQLMAMPQQPCTVAAIDQKTLWILAPTIAFDNVVDQEVMAGNSFTLSLEINNLGQGSYSWYKNDEIMPGQVLPLLFRVNVQPDDAGSYRCVFTNACGQIESNEALVEVLQPVQQVFNLQTGWQGISSYIEPDISNIPPLFAPVQNQMVILSNNQGFYWPAQSINTLEPWTGKDAYQIKMNGNANLVMTGVIRYPRANTGIIAGWSLLPVASSCQVNVADLFAAYPQIIIVKDMAGTKIYWPAFGINTLEWLEPGKGYLIYNSSGSELMIGFPDCESEN